MVLHYTFSNFKTTFRIVKKTKQRKAIICISNINASAMFDHLVVACKSLISILVVVSELRNVQAFDVPDIDINSIMGDKEKPSYFYSAPQVDLQDKGSWSMPPKYRCDACLGVGFQFQKEFGLEEQRRSKKGVPLTESQILDVSDKLCSKGFNKYGAKTVNARPRLSGEGLKAYYEYGMTGIGPGWIERMQGVCKELVGLFEEETIYELYKTRGDQVLGQKICRSYCTKVELEEYKEDLKTMDLNAKLYKDDEL